VLLASMPATLLAQAGGARSPQSVFSDGPVKLTANIDKTTARVVEPIYLVLEVEAPSGTRVEMPASFDQLGDFDVRHIERANDIPAAEKPETRTWILRLTLESIKTGQLTIPPLEAHYTLDANSTAFKTLATAPIPVHIASVLENRAEPTRFRDIKPTIDVPVPVPVSRRWIAWTCGGAAAAATALYLVMAVVKRRRNGLTPAAWAVATLEELEQLDAKTQGPESLFNEVVDVIREYVELEFAVPMLPRTTREVLAEIPSEVGLPEKACKRLEWLAKVADQIKFARLGIGEEHVQRAFAQAKAFIAECEAHRRATTTGAG
jgi:hypothetical protein